MAKIGIINFHHADNYGSVLLAYAMAKVLNDMGHEAAIINYQPLKQLAMYSIPVTTGKHWIKKFLEKICWMPFMQDLRQKVRRYEDFRKKYIPMTPYTNHADEIKSVCGTFDITIAAGDQIWNPRCNEFEWCYYLDFVENGKKIAYAPSMGGTTRDTLNDETYRHIINSVSSFNAVSVRDYNTNAVLEAAFPITLDPTMLLPIDDWGKMGGSEPLVGGDYIFYYDPFDLDDDILHAKRFAAEKACKLIACNLYFIFKLNKKNFEYHLDAGPREFLNYIRFAKVCVGRSFHLAVFSILFKKELLIVGGMKDKRIKELMSKVFKGFDSDLYSHGNDVRITSAAYNDMYYNNMESEINMSYDFLKRAIDE